MSDPFMHQTYTAAMADYEVEMANAERDFRTAQATGDVAGAAYASKQMAHIRTEAGEYHRMSEQVAANMRPQAPVMPSREMIHAMTPEELASTGRGPELLAANGTFNSKYGDVTPDDPYFQYGKAVAAWQRGQGR